MLYFTTYVLSNERKTTAKSDRFRPCKGKPRRERERERERESLHLSSHTGLMQVLPGHPLADTITECSITVHTEQHKSLPKSILTKAVGNEEQLQNMHIPTLSKEPRTTHLPWRQTKEASVTTPSNICELCRATTQCKSTNQTMPGGYYSNTQGRCYQHTTAPPLGPGGGGPATLTGPRSGADKSALAPRPRLAPRLAPAHPPPPPSPTAPPLPPPPVRPPPWRSPCPPPGRPPSWPARPCAAPAPPGRSPGPSPAGAGGWGQSARHGRGPAAVVREVVAGP